VPDRRAALLHSYGVAIVFLILFAAGQILTVALPPKTLTTVQRWASTNVSNLQHHPIPAVILSAFLPTDSTGIWLVIIALAMFGANRAAGNIRLLITCAAGHIIGTAVSEGTVAYRVDTGALPRSWTHIIDIGPSYVVVAAIVVAVLLGSPPARVIALVDFLILVPIGGIFDGLPELHVAAVGHVTSMLTAVVLVAAWLRRRVRQADQEPGDGPSAQGVAQPAGADATAPDPPPARS